MIGLMLALAAAPAATEGPSYKIGNISLVSLPFVISYMQCFTPKSDVAQGLLAAEGADASQLPALCRTRRQPLFDAAVKKIRETGTDDMLQEKRRLERAFNIVDNNNPLPGAASEKTK